MPNRSGETVAVLHGLQDMIGGLDLVICDLWGVMHDGIVLHPPAVTAIQNARTAGAQTVFLSNAPRPRGHVRDFLAGMGLPPPLADNVVTSGGLARDEVRNLYQGARLYHLGPAEDHNTIDGLPVEVVADPADAEIILATGLEYSDVAAHRALLSPLAERGVPFLCANPDRVVHVGERLYHCAGIVADLYETMGGDVHWFGKPTAAALQSCLTEVGMAQGHPGDRILMVGDSLQTDMEGARAAGYQGLFIAGGIHRDEVPLLDRAAGAAGIETQAFQKILGAEKAVPHAVMNKLEW